MTTLIKTGAKGDQVVSLQNKLSKLGFALNPDGVYGPATKKAIEELQTIFGYNGDGIVGDATLQLIEQQSGYGWRLDAADSVKRGLEAQGKNSEKGLSGAALTRTLKPGLDGTDVKYLQRRLSALGFKVNADGEFGPSTETAVRELQKTFGYDVDGMVGEATHKLINQQIGYGWQVGKPAPAQH